MINAKPSNNAILTAKQRHFIRMQQKLLFTPTEDLSPKTTEITTIDAIKPSKTPKNGHLTLFSWNLNGIRAVKNNGLFDHFMSLGGDILCFQEIKAKPAQISLSENYPDYYQYWHSAIRPGYSGTMILSKIPAISYKTNFPKEILQKFPNLHDNFGDTMTEGRVQTLEFKDFFLVNVYTPNSKANLERLNFRHQIWDQAFLSYLKFLEQQKPVITCGDFNAAHQDIDLARPKANHKSAGFTDEERQGITNLISKDFIDTFRTLHPDLQKFSWWSNLGHARERNVGWRIDYFFISKSLQKNLLSAEIHDQIYGSDHCPISITLSK